MKLKRRSVKYNGGRSYFESRLFIRSCKGKKQNRERTEGGENEKGRQRLAEWAQEVHCIVVLPPCSDQVLSLVWTLAVWPLISPTTICLQLYRLCNYSIKHCVNSASTSNLLLRSLNLLRCSDLLIARILNKTRIQFVTFWNASTTVTNNYNCMFLLQLAIATPNFMGLFLLLCKHHESGHRF